MKVSSGSYKLRVTICSDALFVLMAAQDSATFKCPKCETTAPSTSVPYDTLGYPVCPRCKYTPGPDTEG